MSHENFNNRKQTSLAHSLIKVGRLINEQGIKKARELFDLPNLTIAHLELFPYIDFEGTSIGEIARRKNVTKQAVSKLVAQMISMKILYLRESRKDKRIKLVHFHTKGPLAIQQGFKALEDIDLQIKQILAPKSYDLLLQRTNDIIGKIEDGLF